MMKFEFRVVEKHPEENYIRIRVIAHYGKHPYDFGHEIGFIEPTEEEFELLKGTLLSGVGRWLEGEATVEFTDRSEAHAYTEGS